MDLVGGIIRFPGLWDAGALIVLTRGFQKKAQKTPAQQISRSARPCA